MRRPSEVRALLLLKTGADAAVPDSAVVYWRGWIIAVLEEPTLELASMGHLGRVARNLGLKCGKRRLDGLLWSVSAHGEFLLSALDNRSIERITTGVSVAEYID
jgi:hypothetical protein